jgi:hypothetical protein
MKLILASLAMTFASFTLAHAQMGSTLEQAKQKYGTPVGYYQMLVSWQFHFHEYKKNGLAY